MPLVGTGVGDHAVIHEDRIGPAEILSDPAGRARIVASTLIRQDRLSMRGPSMRGLSDCDGILSGKTAGILACLLALSAPPTLAKDETARSVGSAAAVKSSSEFLKQVEQHFKSWDLDHNKELDTGEIEKAVHNPRIKGNEAAAVVSIRRAVKKDKELLPLTADKIIAGVHAKKTETTTPPAYEGMYKSAKSKISAARKDLFASGVPDVRTLHQGRLGDCFLLANLGTLANHDPQRLVSMMQVHPDGTVEVNFGSRTVKMDLPTDGEIGLGASTTNSGLWANTFEKAIGTILLERQKMQKHVTPISIIGVGGSPGEVLRIVTGHEVERHSCTPYRTMGKTAEERAKHLDPLRKDLLAAKAERRMVVGGTAAKGKQTVVPGLVYNHSYGVLDYDEKTDLVTFWNPFGNKYTPKGPDSLEHGYTTVNGQFQVPLADAVMWFGSFSIEQSTPLKGVGGDLGDTVTGDTVSPTE